MCPVVSRPDDGCLSSYDDSQILCSPSPHFSYGVVSTFSSVSTTNTASNFAGSVLLAFSLTLCRSPGISEKLCPARYVATGPSLTELRIAPSRTVAKTKADLACVWADDEPPGPY